MRLIIIFCLAWLLASCGFHLQGEMKLAPPLHRMYLRSPEPYGQLNRYLESNLKMSHVTLVTNPAEADTILELHSETIKQTLLSVSGTQQTRQYNLSVSIEFDVTDRRGMTLVPTQTLSENKAITVQSDQILGSSNEASLYYQQMRRALAYAILNRIASKDITVMINQAQPSPTPSAPTPVKRMHRKHHETNT